MRALFPPAVPASLRALRAWLGAHPTRAPRPVSAMRLPGRPGSQRATSRLSGERSAGPSPQGAFAIAPFVNSAGEGHSSGTCPGPGTRGLWLAVPLFAGDGRQP